LTFIWLLQFLGNHCNFVCLGSNLCWIFHD
jgi:hypothetical protein